MKDFKVIGLRDKVAGCFQGITIEINESVAKRNFAYNVNNSSELLFKAKDIELYVIGILDSSTGVITPVSPLERICSGDEVVENEKI